MANFEDFHVVVRKEASERIAALLRGAGVRIQERVIAEVGHPEYVIAVAVEDIGRAEEVLRQDTGAGRTFTSGAALGVAPDRGGSS